MSIPLSLFILRKGVWLGGDAAVRTVVIWMLLVPWKLARYFTGQMSSHYSQAAFWLHVSWINWSTHQNRDDKAVGMMISFFHIFCMCLIFTKMLNSSDVGEMWKLQKRFRDSLLVVVLLLLSRRSTWHDSNC